MQKDFDGWNDKKKKLHESSFKDFVHAREVWWCAVGANVGVEADGKRENFERPVLVLRKFSQDAVLVVPLTSRVKKDNVYHAVFVHEGREFSAVISQVRLISTKRLLRKMYQNGQCNLWGYSFRCCRYDTKSAPAKAGASGAAWPLVFI